MQGLCVYEKEGDEWDVWEALSKRPMRSCWDGSPVSRRIETSRGCSEADFSCCRVVGLLRHPEAATAGCCQGNCFLCGTDKTSTASTAASTQCLWRRRDFNTSGRAACLLARLNIYSVVLRLTAEHSGKCLLPAGVSHRVSEPAEQRGTLAWV